MYIVLKCSSYIASYFNVPRSSDNFLEVLNTDGHSVFFEEYFCLISLKLYSYAFSKLKFASSHLAFSVSSREVILIVYFHHMERFENKAAAQG
jgi:hypothetical protein